MSNSPGLISGALRRPNRNRAGHGRGMVREKLLEERKEREKDVALCGVGVPWFHHECYEIVSRVKVYAVDNKGMGL